MNSYSERWSMVPTVQSQSNPNTPSNQDNMFLQQQQQSNQQLYSQQPQPQPQQQIYQQQQQTPQPESLASHFHLIHLVENLADAIENGTRDQHSDALVSELNNQFEKCQALLNSISGSIISKSRTVEEQKRKQEEAEDLLNQRRHLISKYRSSIEDLITTDK